MNTRFAQLVNRLKDYGELECLVDGVRGHTYAQLLAGYDRWQARLADLSIAPGAVVGLRADYSLEAIAALLALFARRNVVALIPRDREAAPYLEDARVTGLLDFDDVNGPHWRPLEAHEDHPLLCALRERGDAGVVIFTSGSTGRPKAALQSVERFLSKYRKPGRRFRTLAFLLFDHIAGMDTLFYTLSSGGTLVVTRSRNATEICELISRARVEVLPASPSFLRLLCLAGDAQGADLSSLKIITYGSEPMDPRTLEWLNQRFPHLQITQKYGTTETGSPRSVSRGNDSLWLKLGGAGVETRVIDGVLHLRSEATILGYLNAPSPVDGDGWYCTGDLVDIDVDAEGEWIRFRGRQSDVINVGGEKVAPSEVEQAILSLDFVREAVVSGKASAVLGQIVVAQVVLARAMDAKEAGKAIRARCRERLAAYKVPVTIDFVARELVSARQKVQRAAGAPTS